jgi:quinol monooxygenase YgiN
MLVVTRHRVDPSEATSFLSQAQSVLAAFLTCAGWRSGQVGRAVDDPTLWVLTGEWDDVGSYRRALSAPDVKMAVGPLLATALDEPTAFELLTDGDGAGSALAADASVVGVGEAAAPAVATDFDQR